MAVRTKKKTHPRAIDGGAISAKVLPPRLAQVYERTRLYKWLDSARRRHRIVWVAAPAGSGKTTLVASYLRARQAAAVWYDLDAGDGDVASFYSYLGQAAHQAAPRRTRTLPLFTPEYLGGLAAFSRNYFRLLYAHIRPAPVLVFDDYHEVAEQSPFHEALREGLAEIPEDMCVIVISRAEPPKELARLRMDDSFTLLSWSELRLSPEESAGIGRMRAAQQAANKATLRQLHERTQGWVAGLILMLEQDGAAKGDWDLLPQSASDPRIFDYFAGEVFPRIEPEVQAFLLRAALLPGMTVDAVKALTGVSAADDILAGLFRRNFFTARYQRGKNTVYEFHNLFRQFLLAQGAATLSSDELVALKRQAATLLAANNEIDHAIALLREVEDWTALIPFVLEHAPALIRQGRFQTLGEWLGAIPESLLNVTPWLPYFLGVRHLVADLARARHYFMTSYENFKRAPDAKGLYLAWTGIAESYVYEGSTFKPADGLIEEFEWIRRTYPEFPGRDVEVRAVAAIFSLMIYRQPQHPDLTRWAIHLEDLLRSSADPVERMTVGNYLLLYHAWWTANGPKTEEIMSWLVPASDSKEEAPLLTIMRDVSVAASCWMKGDHEACRVAVRRGLDLAQESGVHMWDFMLLVQDVWASITAGEPGDARRGLKVLRERLHPSRRMDLVHYYFLAYAEARERGDVAQMTEYSHQALRLVEECGSTWIEGIVLAGVALSSFMRGEREAAYKYLDRCNRMIAGTVITPHFALFTEAQLAFASGDEARGIDALRRLFANDRPIKCANAGSWNNAVMAEFCAKALAHDIETDHVRWVIRQRGLTPPRSPAHVARWPWAVRIYTLGRFEVERDENAVSFAGSAGRKPMAMLAALIAFGGRDVNQTTLSEALWPDAEGDTARRVFDTTLHRLRKQLGNDALVLKDGRLSLDDRYCWVDCLALDQLLDGRPVATMSIDETDHFASEMMNLYRGPFLSAFPDEVWALAPRERLRAKLLRQLAVLVRRLEQARHHDKATDLCERAIELDPLGEEFYRVLIRVHLARQQHAAALSVYTRCVNALESLLGLAPSPETEALVRGLAPTRLPS